MTKKQTAAEKRFAAMQNLMNEWYTPEGALREGLSRQEVIYGIDTLYALGKTERWHKSLDNWKAMILNGPMDLHGSIIQGGMHAVHASN